MNAKQPIPVPIVVVIVVFALGLACFFGFKAMSGPGRQAASATEMYGAVQQMAIKSGGDYSKLSASDQSYLDNMSHGHGPQLLKAQYARINTTRGN